MSGEGAVWRWFRVLNEIALHFFVIFILVYAIEKLRLYMASTHADKSWIFFEGNPYLAFPAQWLFDLSDVGVLLGVGVRGAIKIYKAYSKEDDDD